MGKKFQRWIGMSDASSHSPSDLLETIRSHRAFSARNKLDYGDHGLEIAVGKVANAIKQNKRIALYADYDVDGTMSCVSWIWFFRAVGFTNFLHYIPCRFKEGYGVNLNAARHLVEVEKADVIITMDTGITANEEAAYCKNHGVEFICTDHHLIQPEKMPDCVIVNPKMHSDPDYRELCGCGITFVLLRKLASHFSVNPELWTDLLALAGMATLCDMVPLNGVNHRLSRMGIEALVRSRRPVLRQLLQACRSDSSLDETDVGFRLGPRINAVGRLEHADMVVQAFVNENPAELVAVMGKLNDARKTLQASVVAEARQQSQTLHSEPVLFLGGDWHPGVVGIAAGKIAEEFWRPTFLFQRKDGVCKGSARSIPGFDVTAAMGAAKDLFKKFGGHRAAGGFTFAEENETAIRERIGAFCREMQSARPEMWQSEAKFDCTLPAELVSYELATQLSELRPFGIGFEEPKFVVETEILAADYYRCKKTNQPKHTYALVRTARGRTERVNFFNEVHAELLESSKARILLSMNRNVYRGAPQLSLLGHDFEI